MSLIVETGSGSATAESLTSVVYITAYHAARGNSAWALLTTPQMEAAARKATDYFGQVYGQRLQGSRTYPTVQALDLPRVGIVVNDVYVDSDIVPDMIQRAISELALKASAADLQADLTQGVVSESVGPISVQYDRSSPQRVRYTAIDAMLAPFLKAGSNSISMGLVRC